MEVTVGISNRHIHLTEETYKRLFGDEELIAIKDLNQPGQFASNKKLTIKTEKSFIEGVRIIGPFRRYNQIEISKSDAIKLGINPPIRNSGDIEGSAPITLSNGKLDITVDKGCIIPNRHIHINSAQIEKLGLAGLEKVSVRINGIKGGIINNVYLKVSEKSFFELHIDTDDGNAFLLNQGSIVEILKNEN